MPVTEPALRAFAREVPESGRERPSMRSKVSDIPPLCSSHEGFVTSGGGGVVGSKRISGVCARYAPRVFSARPTH